VYINTVIKKSRNTEKGGRRVSEKVVVVRKNGVITLPSHMREVLGIAEGTPVKVILEEQTIKITKIEGN
jgi:AbrB family looped-hinge helix DNA binding protein